MLSAHIKDISGLTFGSLTAIKYSHTGKNNMAHWEYKCICGNKHIARSNTVRYEANRKNDPELPSCGCIELGRKTKHGFRKAQDTHPAYKAYRGIMDRCYNPNSKHKKWYLDKGVTICAEWKDNPESFINWSINNGWKPGLHIDKDILCKEKGIFPHIYSPETCQWVTPKTNVAFATNRNNYGKHSNVKLSHEQVAEILGLYFTGEITSKTELAKLFNLKSSSSIGRLIRIAEGRAN